MGNPTRRQGHAAGPDTLLPVADLHENLALEHVERLVLVGMAMQRRHLPLGHRVLEQEESTPGLLGGGLPRMGAAAVEPALLAVAVGPDDHTRSVHAARLDSASVARRTCVT